jgi:hypothetical protein
MLKDVVISKTLNAKGEASLVYEGGHLYGGASAAHRDYIMGTLLTLFVSKSPVTSARCCSCNDDALYD